MRFVAATLCVTSLSAFADWNPKAYKEAKVSWTEEEKPASLNNGEIARGMAADVVISFVSYLILVSIKNNIPCVTECKNDDLNGRFLRTIKNLVTGGSMALIYGAQNYVNPQLEHKHHLGAHGIGLACGSFLASSQTKDERFH